MAWRAIFSTIPNFTPGTIRENVEQKPIRIIIEQLFPFLIDAHIYCNDLKSGLRKPDDWKIDFEEVIE